MMPTARAGQWVQVYQVVLQPGQRAPQVPPDTQQVPLEMRVKGFLTHDAKLGDMVEIETVIGRRIAGQLVSIEPAYPHNFGRPVPELLRIGPMLKNMLFRGGENCAG